MKTAQPSRILELTKELCAIPSVSGSAEEENRCSDFIAECLRRLAEKGAVRYEDSGSIRTFFPNITREHAAVRQTRDLLGRVYHGSLSMLVSAMTREETLPQEEIDELYALLNEMEAKKRRD